MDATDAIMPSAKKLYRSYFLGILEQNFISSLIPMQLNWEKIVCTVLTSNTTLLKKDCGNT